MQRWCQVFQFGWASSTGVGITCHPALVGSPTSPPTNNISEMSILCSTQQVWTLFLFKSIWMHAPRGVKKSEFFFKNKNVEFQPQYCPQKAQTQENCQCQKNLVFLEYFKNSSIWGQYQRTKPLRCVQWTLAHLLTPQGPLGADPYRIYQGFSICF